MLVGFRKKKDRSLSCLHGESASSSIENAGLAYQYPSILSIGGAARDVCLLGAVTNLFLSLLMLKLPSFIKSGDSLKRGVLILAVVSALAWLPLILVPVFVSGVTPLVLIPLWVISYVPALLVVPVRDKWMADLVPVERMGRYFGLRQTISAGTYITTFYMMGYFLDTSNAGIGQGYVMIFSIAFLGSLISLLLLMVVRSSDNVPQFEDNRFGFLDFLIEARQNHMGTFITYVALVMFATSISSAFFSVYMINELHYTYVLYTLVVSVEFLARVVSLSFWGRLVDRTGAIKLLRTVSFAIPVIPVLWLATPNVVYLMIVQFCSGVAWAAFDLSNQTHIAACSPPSKRLHYIVYQRCIITLASAAGPLLGAYMVNHMFPVFGSQVLGIFLFSGIIRFLVVILLSPKLRHSEADNAGQSEPCFGDPSTDPFQIVIKNTSYGYPKYDRRSMGINVSPRAALETPVDLFYPSKPLDERSQPAVPSLSCVCSRPSVQPVTEESLCLDASSVKRSSQLAAPPVRGRIHHRYPTLQELRLQH
jgi:hypothetical protein